MKEFICISVDNDVYLYTEITKMERMAANMTNIEELIRAGKTFTVAEAAAKGVSHSHLMYYFRKGIFARVAHGVYVPTQEMNVADPEIEVLQKKGTKFVLALLSALRFHEFTTQNPHGVWISLLRGTRTPSVDFEINCVHLNEECFSFGIEQHIFNGMPLQVYSPAKTVADCFKFRNKYGLDVAVEALNAGWNLKRFTISELLEAAGVCKVRNVIMPYLEMLAR